MDLLADLKPHQKHAVELIKQALDCYNSYDGFGEFTGPERYAKLTERLSLAATQSRDLFAFWATLTRRMRWPTPPKKFDEVVLPMLKHAEGEKVLRSLAMETSSIVMLARYRHDQDKAARRAAKKAWEDEGLEVGHEA